MALDEVSLTVDEGPRRPHPDLAPRLRLAQADRVDAEETFEAEALLQDAVDAKASDIHLDPRSDGWQLRFRVDGVIVDVVPIPLDPGRRLVNQLKTLAELNPVTAQVPQDGRFTYQLDDVSLDLRVSVAPCLRGDKLALRVLTAGYLFDSLDRLGLTDDQAEILQAWLDTAAGMLLVSGPTGGGKTTTLYALLHAMRRADLHIVTLEDPVEYEIDGINQIQVDNKAGLTFATGTRSLLRLDPDCMLIGEIRDPDSARAASDAASSGRTLMGTLHSRDAVGAVTVLRNYGLDDFEVAANLEIVISQRLVRSLCRQCRIEAPPADQDRRFLERVGRPVPDKVWTSVGCDSCRGLGFRGRTGLFEVWRLDPGEQALLLEHAPERALRSALAKRNHAFLLESGLAKAEAGETTLGEIRICGLGSRA
ncbi:MAG: ATPase, T2SS/T4P/T4SS family, partial [Aquisalimonadaceae bacterium]